MFATKQKCVWTCADGIVKVFAEVREGDDNDVQAKALRTDVDVLRSNVMIESVFLTSFLAYYTVQREEKWRESLGTSAFENPGWPSWVCPVKGWWWMELDAESASKLRKLQNLYKARNFDSQTRLGKLLNAFMVLRAETYSSLLYRFIT